ncbi:MAG: DUF2804 domain-containing protein [Flavobacteriales bacterium]|nr:DUF2804 domain-containing protein [Flavobacteriales bacterium]
MYSRTLRPAQGLLYDYDEFIFGSFNGPIENPNLIDAKRPYQLPLPRLLKWLQLREWQAFQISNGTHFVMVAIYNAKKISLAQFIVYDISNNKKYRYEKKVPAWSIHVPDGLFGTEAAYRSKNFSLVAKHDLKSNQLRLSASISNMKGLPDVEANFEGVHDVNRYEPMVVCMPFSEKRAMYSHKCLMPVLGNIRFGEDQIEFPEERSQLIIDDHKGYYPYPTIYDWVTGMGRDENGKMIGFNFTDNQILDKENNNENCFWYDGVLTTLPPIKVTRPDGYKGIWHVKDNQGMVDLEFRPVIHTAVDINLLIMRSKYQGPYGFFNGFITNKNGEKVDINEMFGMGEDFYLRA